MLTGLASFMALILLGFLSEEPMEFYKPKDASFASWKGEPL